LGTPHRHDRKDQSLPARWLVIFTAGTVAASVTGGLAALATYVITGHGTGALISGGTIFVPALLGAVHRLDRITRD
jgi:hypothetical protein